MLEFSDEALRLASDYAKEVETEVRNFAVDLKPEYVKLLILDIENDVKFFALKVAAKRGSKRVEVVDVGEVFKKFGKPEDFVKSHIGKAQNCLASQKVTFSNLETVREKLERIETPLILDAGCRWGRFSKKLKDFTDGNLRIVGVDLDKLSLQYGKGISRTTVFLRSDIQALPFRNEVFDVVLCTGVIHEVRSSRGRRKTVQEFSRVLSSKGLLSLVDASTKLRIISAVTFVFQHVTGNVEWIPKKEAIEKTLRESGLEIISSMEGSVSYLGGTVVPYTVAAIKTPRAEGT